MEKVWVNGKKKTRNKGNCNVYVNVLVQFTTASWLRCGSQTFTLLADGCLTPCPQDLFVNIGTLGRKLSSDDGLYLFHLSLV